MPEGQEVRAYLPLAYAEGNGGGSPPTFGEGGCYAHRVPGVGVRAYLPPRLCRKQWARGSRRSDGDEGHSTY